jgi:hypothetical protein
MTFKQLGGLSESQKALIVRAYEFAGSSIKKMPCIDCETCAGGIKLPIPGNAQDGLTLCLVLSLMEPALCELASAIIRSENMDTRPSPVEAGAAL